MKLLHFIVYMLINLLFVFLISYTGLNINIKALLIFLMNAFIIFFIQKQTISEVQYMVENIINVGNKPEDNKIKDEYIAGFNDLKNQFAQINDEIKAFSKETQKPLTTSIEAILNSTHDGIIVVNNDRDIIMANDSFFSLCGYRAYEISGKDSTTMVSPENILSKNLIRFIKYSFENAETNMNNVSTGVIEITHIKPHKTLRATATSLKYNSDSLDGLVINLKDITKELEANEEKNKFVSGISHEFRTPLFSIMGYSSLINEDENLDKESVQKFGKTIYEESIRLSDIIDNLLNILTLDKPQSNLTIEKINLRDIVVSVVNEFEQKIKSSNLKIILNFDNENLIIVNNRENLSTIVSNLISNCIKFSDKSKEIILEVKQEDNNVNIAFTNFGVGIPKEEQNKIFEKFYRVETNTRKIPGAGLGLFIAKRIAKLHGGNITFDSQENGKTVFDVTLPLVSKYDKESFKSMDIKKQIPEIKTITK